MYLFCRPTWCRDINMTINRWWHLVVQLISHLQIQSKSKRVWHIFWVSFSTSTNTQNHCFSKTLELFLQAHLHCPIPDFSWCNKASCVLSQATKSTTGVFSLSITKPQPRPIGISSSKIDGLDLLDFHNGFNDGRHLWIVNAIKLLNDQLSITIMCLFGCVIWNKLTQKVIK